MIRNRHNSTFKVKRVPSTSRTDHPRTSNGTFAVKPGSRRAKICPACGKRFEYWVNKVPVTKTCSLACAGKLKTQRCRENRTCKHCSQTFSFVLSALNGDSRRGQYCSAECRNKAKVQRHEQQGVKSRYKNEAHLIGDKLWKAAVREKDNYTCQRCGVYQRYIHAHHVAPRSRRPDLIRVIENGKCLCASCHAWVHMNPKEATALGLLSDETYEKARKRRNKTRRAA